MLVRALEIKDERLFNYIIFCVLNRLSIGNSKSLKLFHENEVK